MTPFKIFGCMRTGTNYFCWLLRRHWEAKYSSSEASGWKHGKYNVPERLGREIDVVVIAKHPLSWLPSIKRYRKKPRGMKMAGFVNEMKPVEHWNAMYDHWSRIELKDKALEIVRYEDLIQRPKEVCVRVARAFGMKRIPGRAFKNPKRRMVQPTNVPTGGPFDRGYYTKWKFLKDYKPSVLKDVQNRIDWDVVRRLGYEGKWAEKV